MSIYPAFHRPDTACICFEHYIFLDRVSTQYGVVYFVILVSLTNNLFLSQEQIARLFETERSVVTKHINKVFNDEEVIRKSNVQKMHIAQSDKPVQLYSLDVILAVGYRINSGRAITFRKWATAILRKYLVNGYELNQQKLASSPERVEGLREAVALLESTQHPGKVKAKMILKITKDMKEVEPTS